MLNQGIYIYIRFILLILFKHLHKYIHPTNLSNLKMGGGGYGFKHLLRDTLWVLKAVFIMNYSKHLKHSFWKFPGYGKKAPDLCHHCSFAAFTSFWAGQKVRNQLKLGSKILLFKHKYILLLELTSDLSSACCVRLLRLPLI